jgi:hypothetical protein
MLLRFLLLLAYWGLLLWVAMPQGLQTDMQPFPGWTHFTPAASNHDLIRLMGDGDPGSYARGAWDMYKHHSWFGPQGDWFMNCWAPGFFWLQVKLMKWLHLGAHQPIVVWLIVMTTGLWAAVLADVQRMLRRVSNNVLPGWLCALLPLALLGSALFRDYFLSGGTILTESISSACVWLAALAGMRAAAEKRPGLALMSGVWLAAGAYLRAQVELMGTLLTLLAGAWLLLRLLPLAVGSKPRPTAGGFWARLGDVRWLLLGLLLYHGLTLPYRLYTLQRTGSLAWNQSNYVWTYHWKTQAQLNGTPAAFYATGGMTTACDLNPARCEAIQQAQARHKQTHPQEDPTQALPWTAYRDAAIQTFLQQPWAWLAYKFGFMPSQWMADQARQGNAALAFWENITFAACTLLFGLAAVWQAALAFWRACQGQDDAGAWAPWLYAWGLLTTTAVFFVFVQIEPRYYFQLKITAALAVLAMGASALATWRNSGQQKTTVKKALAPSSPALPTPPWQPAPFAPPLPYGTTTDVASSPTSDPSAHKTHV